jgi:iron complex outermembrane receptor protein
MKHCLITLMLLAFSLTLYAQEDMLTITGKVTDLVGIPMSGVSIQVKGTNRSTVTGSNGSYTIRAKRGEILLFSVEPAPIEKVVRSENVINVSLTETINDLGNLTIVGSRRYGRSATGTISPVDVIPIAKIMNQVAQADINQLLQYAAPSFNANKQSGADGADHIDPATLRGLGPDQTLVLINGKRRHQSSLVNLYGTRGRGNTGTDLNAIPVAAIERIEILRDGASAQYGSDAIAGVINIVLKKETNQLTANAMYGTYITGYGESVKSSADKLLSNTTDGGTFNLNMNYGLGLKNNGFINLTADYLRKNKTQRPNFLSLYPDSYRNRFGDMSMDNLSLWMNSEMPCHRNSTFYSFGGYSYRNGDAFAWTRDPGSERNVTAIYPNGFDPHIQSKIHDRSISFGMRTKSRAWNADLNTTIGNNRFHFFVDKSLNASLEAASPTHFDAGGFGLTQYVLSAGFSRLFPHVNEGLNLAFGAEARNERYNIFAGEASSWKTYGPVIFSINGTDTTYRPGGSQGFPGFQPKDASKNSRSNIGAYADAEWDISKVLLLAGAIRIEDYSDFGFTSNYKLATRIKLDNHISLRSSFSTGFRAPSLPQVNFSSTFTDVVAGTVVDKVIAPNNSTLAKLAGIPELKEESSVNFSLGFTAKSGGFSLTADGYLVTVDDRIVLTGAFDDQDNKIGTILQSMNIGAAQFFTNAVDTRTKGLDVIAAYTHRIAKGNFTVTLAGNINDMEIRGITTTTLLAGKEDIYFGKREQAFLLASAPKHKFSLGTEYSMNKWNFFARLNRFSGVQLVNWNDDADVYKNKLTADLSAGYKLSKGFSITIGGSNIFDIYPTHHDPGLTETGGMWDAVQMGFGGAFWFVRAGLKL